MYRCAFFAAWNVRQSTLRAYTHRTCCTVFTPLFFLFLLPTLTLIKHAGTVAPFVAPWSVGGWALCRTTPAVSVSFILSSRYTFFLFNTVCVSEIQRYDYKIQVLQRLRCRAWWAAYAVRWVLRCHAQEEANAHINQRLVTFGSNCNSKAKAIL